MGCDGLGLGGPGRGKRHNIDTHRHTDNRQEGTKGGKEQVQESREVTRGTKNRT
jgi:hypothetical protein